MGAPTLDPGAARPREVTAAGLVLLALPLVSVVSLVSGLVAISIAQDNAATLADRLTGEGYADADRVVRTVVAGLWAQIGAGTVVKVIQAVALGGLAFFVRRGSPGARVAVFVIAGLTTLGAICSGVLTGSLRTVGGSVAPDGGLTVVDESDVLPGWYQPVNYVSLALSVVMVGAVAWLLTRPAANAYFRRGSAVPAATTTTPPPTAGRPWYRRRAVVAAGVVVLFLVIVVGGNALQRAFFAVNTAPADESEPSHRVGYQVSTVGTANGDLDIRYTSADGDTQTESPAGFSMVWFKQVTTDRGLTQVYLEGSGNSSDLGFRMSCTITVDGRLAERQTGPYACSASVDLRAARLSGTRLPTVGPPATTSPPTVGPTPTPTRPPVPAACRYVTTSEAERIVSPELTDSGIKPVLSIGGDARRCTYTFDYQASRVTFSWTPGGKARGFPGTEISGLGTKAYWVDYGLFGTLEVQLRRGMFKVEPWFQLGGVDMKKVSVELFRTARKRLPR